MKMKLEIERPVSKRKVLIGMADIIIAFGKNDISRVREALSKASA